MSLRITAVLLAVFCSINLRAADEIGDETLAGHPSETVSQSVSPPARTIMYSGSGLIRYRVPLDQMVVNKVNSLFESSEREFPFSPRMIRQSNYDMEIVDESLLSDEFLNQGGVWQKRNTGHSSTEASGIIQTSGTAIVDLEGNRINITRAGSDGRAVPVLGDCEGEGACVRRVNSDEQPINVVLVDCDEACDAACSRSATAHVPEPAPGLPGDGSEVPTAEEIQRTLPPSDAALRRPVGTSGLKPKLMPRFGLDAFPSAHEIRSGTNAVELSVVSEACSNAEPPLKAKVEHLLEAARHLAGAGYEDEAKLFRVEAEAIQRASTRLLTEKRQELERLHREIAELELLTGEYDLIQLDFRIVEFSRAAECEAGHPLGELQAPGFRALAGAPCPQMLQSSILSGTELTDVLRALAEHPCSRLKILSAPKIITTNGRTAVLESGGSFLIPVSAEVGGDAKAGPSSEQRDCGIKLQALPLSIGNNKLRLDLVAEVTERDFGNAVQVEGTSVPGLFTRRVNTAVEARFGDVIAISCNPSTSDDGVQQSLLVLVTPHRVQPHGGTSNSAD